MKGLDPKWRLVWDLMTVGPAACRMPRPLDLSNAYLAGADLARLTAHTADLTGAILTGANLERMRAAALRLHPLRRDDAGPFTPAATSPAPTSATRT